MARQAREVMLSDSRSLHVRGSRGGGSGDPSSMSAWGVCSHTGGAVGVCLCTVTDSKKRPSASARRPGV